MFCSGLRIYDIIDGGDEDRLFCRLRHFIYIVSGTQLYSEYALCISGKRRYGQASGGRHLCLTECDRTRIQSDDYVDSCGVFCVNLFCCQNFFNYDGDGI